MEKLSVTETMKQNLLTATKWLNFLNILWAISMAFCVLFSIAIFFIPIVEDSLRVVYALAYLAIVAIYCYPLRKSFALAKKTKEAMNSDSQEALETCAACYKSILKFFGIFAIVALALYAVAGIVGVVIMTSAL